MPKNKRNKVEPIPDHFDGFDELANFWDTHDLTDYENHVKEVNYKVAVTPTRHFVLTLSDELTKELRKAVQREGVSMQTLINLWVQERLQQYQTR